MQDQHVVNGINVTQWNGTVEAVREQPTLAKFQARAQNTWVGGSQNQSRIKGFHAAGQEDTSRTEAYVLDADEPIVLLGHDQAPNPAEYVLHALAACLTSSLVYHAAVEGLRIQAIESTVVGNLDLQRLLKLRDDLPLGFEDVTATFRVQSDAPAEQLERLLHYSPILGTLTSPVPVQLKLETHATEGELVVAA